MLRGLNWRVIAFGLVLSAVAGAATPYMVLKLGMSTDLSFGGMMLAAVLFGRTLKGKAMAVQLNLLQNMINMVGGVGFMCVILAAFYYVQNVFGEDIGFNAPWWQIAIWAFVLCVLGIFVGIGPRKLLLNDVSLPWPTGKAVLNVVEPLSDEGESATSTKRRTVLTTSTVVAGLVCFLRDSLGVITPIVGKASIGLMLSFDLLGIGMGMFLPLSVGLSGLLGVWILANWGEPVAQWAALNGTTQENWGACLDGIADGEVTDFITNNCGHAAEYMTAGSHFKFVIMWMMWPATAMMIFAALTAILIPVIKKTTNKKEETAPVESTADEYIPWYWTWGGIVICTGLLVWLQDAWFQMPWQMTLVAVGLQPILIIAGLRVLAITGQGPVSLMANATQFIFGLLWPDHIMQNLGSAYTAANPQATSEGIINSFWVGMRVGGKFLHLVVVSLIALPVGCILLPIVFSALEQTYGIGPDPGQLSAPTGLKIASLAMVMRDGLTALPHGALTASIWAAVIGIVFEILLSFRKKNEEGNEAVRFSWVPIPSALGFALILPPFLTIALAIGSMISWVWRRIVGEGKTSTATLYLEPMAAGFIAGEAIVGAIFIPAVTVIIISIPTMIGWAMHAYNLIF